MTSPAASNPSRRRLLLGACSAGVAGCSTLLPKPPAAPVRHLLDVGAAAGPAAAALAAPAAPVSAAAPRLAANAPALLVALPRAAPGYGSNRMLYQQQPHELQAFAYNEWVEPPAQLLAPLIVRVLQDSGAFAVVLLAPTSAVAGLRLETELIRLHQDFSTRPSRLRLTLRAVLLDTRTRQAVAWREFDDSVAATSDDPTGGVLAAQQAVQRVLASVAAFCAQQVRR